MMPKHKKEYRLEVFTNLSMSENEFNEMASRLVLGMEMAGNQNGALRCHFREEGGDDVRMVYEVPQRTPNPR